MSKFPEVIYLHDGQDDITWSECEEVGGVRYLKSTDAKSHDAYAVIEQDGRIGYTSMVLQDGIPESQADETARQFCHEHINDCAESGVEGAGLWVVRPINIGRKEPGK